MLMLFIGAINFYGLLLESVFDHNIFFLHIAMNHAHLVHVLSGAQNLP